MTPTYVPERFELGDESPEAILDLLESRGLGDGLPVIPPTPARVEAMLEHARMPAQVFRRHFEERAWTQWMKVVSDDHLLPMTGEPGNIRIVVAGGPGKHSLVVPSWGMTRSVTLPVEG